MAEGKLREVEEDAVYITEKRFREHFEEQGRAQEQKARAEAKKAVTPAPGTGFNTNDNDKKGK